ncbi:MAG TPA: non-homologous end-joining DNA ligase [Casimicrobiaceae bacterium]|nr:non-homologous end-joining DNA ligase [Casimicrobiaceae bacterium]
MQSPLATYRRKRDFSLTPEPGPKRARARSRLIFVIQKHAARRLHYDFRLELDGVLKSWAVPKEPPDRVGVKRLAVHVEDHPVAYASFEGDIPKGQYGGGHVDIWDRGTWTPVDDPREGLARGRLLFDLDGERLRGRYALIRMKAREGERAENWLLIRERDAGDAPVKTKRPRKAEGRGSTTRGSVAPVPQSDSATSRMSSATAKASASSRGSRAGKTQAAVVAGVRITNPQRPVAQVTDVSKLDVVSYHETVAQWLLPHIARRPLAVIKCPGGDFGNCFFQKHASDPRRPGRTTAGPNDPPYMKLATLKSIIEAVQNGVFEFHSWGCSFPRLDRPDRIVLDLDPDPAVDWPTFRAAADRVRELLDDVGLRWFVKTTGGKGLHFVVPLARRYTWDEVKQAAAILAQRLVDEQPELFIATASKAKRSGKVFVDYLRNAEGATAVAAYSLRARAGLPVSMPIAWSDLERDVRGAFFNLRNVPELLARRKRDPWADYGEVRQGLPKGGR